jgi:hypothetical protein
VTGSDLPLRFPRADAPERSCDALPMCRGRVRARTLAEAGERADLTVMATTFGAGAHTAHRPAGARLLIVRRRLGG